MLEVLAALAKFLLYAGSLSGAGTAFASASLAHRLGASASLAPGLLGAGGVVALAAAAASVVILVVRLGGDFSGPALSAVLEGRPGLAFALQVAGGVVLLALAWALQWLRPGTVIGGALLIASFAVNGHGAAAGLVPAAVAFLHVAAAAWWLGSLLFLHRACRLLPAAELALLVRRFSRIALTVVGGLVVAGAALILSLVDFGSAPWLSPYGQVLALKVALAASVLGLAAWNKFTLTPQLANGSGEAAVALRRSIGFELGLFGLVLAATAALTTYTSPHA